MTDTASAFPKGAGGLLGSLFKRAEQAVLMATLALTTVLLLIDAFGRPLGGFHVPGKDEYVKQPTLWLAFVGGLAAAVQSSHLRLSTAEFFGEGRARRISRLIGGLVAAAVVAVLAKGAFDIVRVHRALPEPEISPDRDSGMGVGSDHAPGAGRNGSGINERLIVYSLGNFATYLGINVSGRNGLAPIVTATLDGEGRFVSGHIHSNRQERPGGPRPDATFTAARLMARVTDEDFTNPGLKILENGTIERMGGVAAVTAEPAGKLLPARVE